MSNHLAVATVTAALRQAVQDALNEAVSGAMAQVGRPKAGADDEDGSPLVNVFLYQVAADPAQRNNHLPSRTGDGRTRGQTVAALDLHYLLSFYGVADTYGPEVLLGVVTRALEHRPIIGRELIEKAIEESGSVLDDTDLHRAAERVRLTPINLSIDDLSKLWSVMFQVPYVLSTAYKCSTVLIESVESGGAGPPVTSVGLGVVTLGGPIIDAVESAVGPGAPIVWGGSLVLRGKGLDRDGMILRVGGLTADLAAATRTADRLTLPLAPASFGGQALAAGSVSVQTLMAPPSGMPAHLARPTDRAAFTLRAVPSLPPGAVQADAAAPGDPTDGEITVAFSPPIAKDQEVRLLLDERTTTAPKSYSLKPVPIADAAYPAAQLKFVFEQVRAASYLLQVTVDGAASAPQTDDNPASPTYRQIIGPLVTIP
jgi:hypothetical protein